MKTFDATVLIPTFNSEFTLPYAVNSALTQTHENIEILIAGDGVSEDYRNQIISLQQTDDRIRFLDLPKGLNRGERNRHFAVLDSNSDRVIYLADDDILMPRHVERQIRLLEIAPFAMSQNGYIDEHNELNLFPTDLSEQKWVDWHLLNPPRNRVSITGTSHLKSFYLELAEGWTVVNPGEWTDLALWKQFFALPNFKGITDSEMTVIQLPANFRELDQALLKEKYDFWFNFSQSEDGHQQLQKLVSSAGKRQLIETSAELTNHSIALTGAFERITLLEQDLETQMDVIKALNSEIISLNAKLKLARSSREALKTLMRRFRKLVLMNK